MPGILNNKSADLLKQSQGPLNSPALQNANQMSAPFNGGQSILNANIEDQNRLNQYGIAGNVGVKRITSADIMQGPNANVATASKKVSGEYSMMKF